MHKLHNDYVHSAHNMQYAPALHVCKYKNYIFGAAHILHISPFFVFCTYVYCHCCIHANCVQNIPSNMRKM